MAYQASCRVCGAKNIREFFDLGKQPLANSLLKSPTQKEESYPLALARCARCALVQLSYTVDPKKLFSHYVWVTGTSGVAKKFADTFYKNLIARTQAPRNGYVMEVASNDGTFLRPFIRDNYRVLGIDPAANIVRMANKNGVPTKCLFWGADTAKRIVKKHGQARIIFARNVLAHVANTRDFMRGLAHALHEDGTLAIEVHYAGKILGGLQYDSIYHEHLCYFTFKPLENLLKQFGFFVYDIKEGPISGGSLIVYAKKGLGKERAAVERYRKRELRARVNTLRAWREFSRRSYAHRERFSEILNAFSNRGVRVIGWGASARSSTMLNFCRITGKQIPIIADLNPLKRRLFTAGTHIPIDDPNKVMRRKPEYVVILAWNFADEIIDILRKKLYYSGRVLVPLPNKPIIKEI